MEEVLSKILDILAGLEQGLGGYLILMGAEPFLVMPLLIYRTQQKIKGQIHT